MNTKCTTNRIIRARRKAIMRRRIHTISGLIACLSIIYIIGIVGGVDQDLMTLKEFDAQAIIVGIIAGISGWICHKTEM